MAEASPVVASIRRSPRLFATWIPTLSKPNLFALRNRVKYAESPPKELLRLLGLCGLGFLLALASYSGTISTLYSLEQYQHVYYIPPVRLLEVLLFFLFGITVLTSAVSFLGIFLLSNDLDLIRAAPISPAQFFLGKFTELVSFSSWILLFFGVPVLLAYGEFFHHPFPFYITALFLLPLFLLLATGTGALAVLVVSAAIPAYRARDFILLLALTIISGSYIWFRTNAIDAPKAQVVQDIVQLSLLSSSVFMTWFPPYWFAHYLAGTLIPDELSNGLHLMLIVGATGVTLSALYLGVRIGFEHLYSKTRAKRRAHYRQSPLILKFSAVMHKILPQQRYGIVRKELKLFLRDVTQSIQLMLLLTLCLVYLYNFQNFKFIHLLPESSGILWRTFFSMANIMMGGFVLVAMSARFVYPSLSLEGKAWWILQASPVSYASILKEKVFFWCFIFSLPTSVIFLAGALALQLPIILVAFQVVLGLSFSHLFFSLGIAFGTRHVDFNWEHPAQLTSNLGSFLFMAAGSVLLLASLVPVSIATVLYLLAEGNALDYQSGFGSAFVLFSALYLYWNFTYSQRLIRRAAKELELK